MGRMPKKFICENSKREIVKMAEKPRLRTEYRFIDGAVEESVIVTRGHEILFVGFYDNLNQLLVGVGEPGRIDDVKSIDIRR